MFKRLTTYDEAKKLIKDYFSNNPSSYEEISLLESYGRILAENVTASIAIPPFDRSTVDGYALQAEDTFCAEENKPVKLQFSGRVEIGRIPKITVHKRSAAEIATGAPIPEGADAVSMIEYTERKGDIVAVFAAVSRGENIMKAGTDIKKGEKLLGKGRILGSRETGLLAAVGRKTISVYKIPCVTVLSTGPEIIEPGKKLSRGKIYNTNAYSLTAAVSESGGKPVYLGVFPDEPLILRKALMKALRMSDLVVTSGAASVGTKDIVPKTLDTLGKPGVILSGIAIKPGKPVTVASISGKAVFSLPGHPTSALLTFILFVRPLIHQLGGRKTETFEEVNAYTSMRMFPAKGRRTFVMVKLNMKNPEKPIAEPVESGLSGAITTLARADGFVEIPEYSQFVDSGEAVKVKLFRSKNSIGY
jgi:molybdenum cofactor synthesis domain-containing protein